MLPERSFFFGVLATVYPDEIKEMVAQSRRLRSHKHAEANDEMIELTDDIKQEIDEILNQASKFYYALGWTANVALYLINYSQSW